MSAPRVAGARAVARLLLEAVTFGLHRLNESQPRVDRAVRVAAGVEGGPPRLVLEGKHTCATSNMRDRSSHFNALVICFAQTMLYERRDCDMRHS
jgi:hypothetical protein